MKISVFHEQFEHIGILPYSNKLIDRSFMKIDDTTAERVAHVLKAVGHPVRLQIVELLAKGEKCVGDIVDALGVKQSITSQHLNLMRDREVLDCRRDGAKVYYFIKNKNVLKLLHCVYDSSDATGQDKDR